MPQLGTKIRPQKERHRGFPRYVIAIFVVCAIVISLNFAIVKNLILDGTSVDASTIISSVLSISNPDGDSVVDNEDDDTYPAAGEDDETEQNTKSNDDNAKEKGNDTPVASSEGKDEATIDMKEKNDTDKNDPTDGDSTGKVESQGDTIDTKEKNDTDKKYPIKDDNVGKDESQGGETKSKDDRLNILILYPDDWRHDSIGSEKPYVLTPILNQLANEGIRFTHNAVTSSICWMSRATLWMGQYTSRHQSYKLKCPMFATKENWKHSWVSILKKSGYFLGHIGKWQYRGHPNRTNSFDFQNMFEGKHWYPTNGGKMIHGSDKSRDHAFEFLQERPKDKPFALSIAFYPPKPVGSSSEPGAQWQPKNETRKMYDNVTIPEPENMKTNDKLPKFLQQAGASKDRNRLRYGTPEHFQASMKNYYALITGVDKAIGEIIEALKKEDLYKNTMIIFTTDNGMFHGSHGLAGKWYPYQESIRVPLIIYDPRMPPEKVGTLDDSLTLNVDLAETILGAAGVKPDDLMQGRDISDLYLPNEKNEFHDTASVKSEPWRDDFFYEFPYWGDNFIPASTALVNKEWKYINWINQKYEQLFNLKDDPLEINDLYNNTDAQSMLEGMRKRHNELKGIYHNETFMENLCIKENGYRFTPEMA